MTTRKAIVIVLSLVFGQFAIPELPAVQPVVFLKGPGPFSPLSVFEPEAGKRQALSFATGMIYELSESGNGRIHEMYAFPATPKKDRIEFGQLRFPYLRDPVGVEIYRNDSDVYGVNFGNLSTAPEKAVVVTFSLANNQTYHVHPVSYMEATRRERQVPPNSATLQIHGCQLTGRLYIAPLKNDRGLYMSPATMIGEYFVVTDVSQRFEYNSAQQRRRGSSQDQTLLFSSVWHTKADIRIRDDGRLELSPRQDTTGVPGSSFSSEKKADDELPQGLIFGRVVEVGRRYRPWVLQDSGVFDTLRAEFIETLSRDSGNLEALTQRGNIYRQAGEFALALTDHKKVDKPLFVEVVSKKANLQVDTKVVGVASQGDILKVGKTNGTWLWVESADVAHPITPGWINQEHVR
jgi:hypothetical protein